MISRIGRIAAVVLTLAVAGCFGPGTPEEQIQEIEELLAAKVPMTEKQKADFETHYTRGKEALAGGNKEQAGEALGKALDVLTFARDAALYNKSD